MSTTIHLENRATLEHQKREVINKILAIWLANPHLRLGQLIINALPINGSVSEMPNTLFYLEDYKLLALIEKQLGKQDGPIYPQITIQINK